MAHSRLVAMADSSAIAISSTTTVSPELPQKGVGSELPPSPPPNKSRAPSSERPSAVHKYMGQFLVIVRELLPILTAWSHQQATPAEVSDVFVRLGTEYQLLLRAFIVIGVETSDLGDVTQNLRGVLETVLGLHPTPQNLELYIPRIKEIITDLLHGLKKKEQLIHWKSRSYKVPIKMTREEGAPADLSHHLNAVSRARIPSIMKSMYKYFMMPGMTNLAGGLPFPGYFPFDTLESSISTATRFVPPIAAEFHSLNPTAPSAQSSLFSIFSFGNKSPSPVLDNNKSTTHFSIPKFSSDDTPLASRIDVASALQYTMVNGLVPLQSFIKDFALNHLHGGRIPYSNPGPDILLSCGNTDGLGKVISLLGERGDSMLVDEFTYPNGIQTAKPYGINIVPVSMDSEGMSVEGKGGLRDVLENWDHRTQGKRPHLMYTVTIGQNPTGRSLSLERRKGIYALCELFDIIIIEDDPYWYLQYTESSYPDPSVPPREGKYPFLEAMTPSFLTLDVSGRVIRLDTFSKTIAPGCRLGWITAQPDFIDRIARITESSTQAPSGFSQAMVAKLVSVWGMDGWVQWLENLRRMYAQRMLDMCETLEAHAEIVVATSVDDADEVVLEKVRMYSFEKPMGGMFIWVHLHLASHPAYQEYTEVRGHTKLELATQMWVYVAETQLSLPCPGWSFAASDVIKNDLGPEKLRFCFAAIEEDGVKEATERFGKGLESFWGLSAADIEDWGEKSDERRARGETVNAVSLGWTGGVVGGGC